MEDNQVEEDILEQLVGDRDLYFEGNLALEDKVAEDREFGMGMEEAGFCHPL